MCLKIWLKRICVLLLLLITIVGIRLYDNGLCTVLRAGKFSYFNHRDEQIFCCQPLFCPYKYQRIELNAIEAKQALENLMIEVVATENFDTVCVFYGRSPLIYGGVTVNGQEVNIMIATRKDCVIVGTPVLKGSY